MKTSASQFELMVSFMEEHGDITKPNSSAGGRLRSLNLWEQLTNLLNSDGGDTKPTDKWKKVWSDFKNNTKKKAARLNKAAVGTGGGPAAFAKLTDLEQRVLQLVGVQSATGLPAEEAGLPQMINPAAATSPPPASPLLESQANNYSCERHEGDDTQSRTLTATNLEVLPAEFVQAWDAPSTSRTHIPEYIDTPHSIEAVENSQLFTIVQRRPVSSPPHVFEEMLVEDPETLLPARPTTPPATSRPTLSGQTPRRSRVARVRVSPRHARGTRVRASPRRRVRPAHTEQAAQHFLHSDEEWRMFRIRQHQDYMENKREANRIRAMELEGERERREMEREGRREWQALGARALDMIEKIVHKFC